MLIESKIDTESICICPVLDELSIKDTINILKYYKNSIKFLSLQGYFRKVKNKFVYPKKFVKNVSNIIELSDIVVFSNEDVPNYKDFVKRHKRYNKIFVITLGKSGAKIFEENIEIDVPIYEKAKVVDPTGAGDTFLSALATKYMEVFDIHESCLFASCAASVVIENKWINAIKKSKNFREIVENRFGELKNAL